MVGSRIYLNGYQGGKGGKTTSFTYVVIPGVFSTTQWDKELYIIGGSHLKG